jgi:hypothetical protein
LSLASSLWLIALIRSFRRQPVTIDEQAVRFRLGRLRSVAAPIQDIARLKTSWPPGFHKRKSVLNLALASYPNIIVELVSPIAGRRGRPVWAIAHRLDDASEFCRVLGERLAAAAPVPVRPCGSPEALR